VRNKKVAGSTKADPQVSWGAWQVKLEGIYKREKMKYTIAEIFCGCGGLSRGFELTGKFRPVFANDVKKEALLTYEFNHRHLPVQPAIVRSDIRTVPLSRIGELIKERGVRPGELDCLIGGPPCQGFSQLRRTEERRNGKIVKFRGYSSLSVDPRNDLVLRFLEIAEFLKPKFIVIENVPQMLKHSHQGRLGRLAETIVNMLEKEMGYSVSISVINTANYGVPQQRERAIFIASAAGGMPFPKATHWDPSDKYVMQSGLKPWVTVGDALRDLPEPIMGHDELGGKSLRLYKGRPSEYARELRTSSKFPFNHVMRGYSTNILGIIKQMRQGETWDAGSARMRKTYEQLAERVASREGIDVREAMHSLIQKGKVNPSFFKKYYWSAYSRLAWDAPALTITANANFLGSGRFSHPESMRGITMREAARLQSFDDDFTFITSPNTSDQTSRIGIGMDMIGEAVPPLMAKALAKHLLGSLESRSAWSASRTPGTLAAKQA